MNRMCRYLLVLILTNWMTLAGWTQTRCFTMEVDQVLREAYPELGSTADFERWLQHAQSTHASTREVQGDIYVVPVIVHVIHNGTAVGQGANLSVARIQSQLDVLNEDFRRALGTPGYNTHPDGADVEIEFCAATVAPDGSSLAEPGVDRIDRNQAGFNSPPYAPNLVRSTIMPNTYWDPDRYMNIWVVDLRDDVLGFAQLPNQSTLGDLPTNHGPEATDGVVIDPDNFGRGAGASSPYDLGRTTTHEVGHWLGLRHVWGDGNCNVDDFCGDTPDASNPNYGCPTNPSSCGSPDMFQNYMDYTDDACMNIFTQCQRTRMRTVMTQAVRRATLLSSTACQGAIAPVAAFRANQTQVCAGGAVSFFDQSLYGPTTWQWSFPGGSPASSTQADPVVSYTSPGTYDVSLTVSNTLGTQSITQTAFITVVGGNGEILVEDFENGLNDWLVQNPDNSYGWELASVSGNGGFSAAYVNLFVYGNTGQRDQLQSPLLNLQNYWNLELQFDHAYRPFTTLEQDSLIVWASVDGGLTFPYRLYANAQGGSEPFATGPLMSNDFVPTQATDWCGNGTGASCVALTPGELSMLNGQSQVRLRFETVNAFGNNIYVDNVRLTGECFVATTVPDPAEAEIAEWQLFPNPAEDVVMLSWSGAQELPAQSRVSLIDITGRVVSTHTLQASATTSTLQVKQYPRGHYLIRIDMESGEVQHERLWLR